MMHGNEARGASLAFLLVAALAALVALDRAGSPRLAPFALEAPAAPTTPGAEAYGPMTSGWGVP